MHRLATLVLLVACASPAGNDSGAPLAEPTTSDPAEGCAGYPDDVVEPMTVGEVLPPYSWPDARHRSDGRRASLELAHVPCDTDDDIDWSPFDVLLFISIPAW